MKTRKKGRPIAVHSSQCTGCLMCELRCSFRFEQAFNPSKARIEIRRTDNGEGFNISFAEECDDCGLCARLCPYGALIQASKA